MDATSNMKALIFGITGQDGSYLSELLLSKGYEVHGVIRRSSSFNTGRIDHIFSRLNLHYGDITDASCVSRLIGEIRPDEIYNLAAQSHVKVSFELPEYTIGAGVIGTLAILEAIKKGNDKCHFYNASSSEMFGNSLPPQNEETPFDPQSPYAVAKVAAHQMTKIYREAYGLFACNGILFNHESPRRGDTFVTQKIVKALVHNRPLVLGNLDAKRDWGHAKDYVEAMWLMLQQDKPDDFVIATGEQHSVMDFLDSARSKFGARNPTISIDKKYFRPLEVNSLCGDASKALKILGWKPKISFEQLIEDMVKSELCK